MLIFEENFLNYVIKYCLNPITTSTYLHDFGTHAVVYLYLLVVFEARPYALKH